MDLGMKTRKRNIATERSNIFPQLWIHLRRDIGS